MVSFKVHIVAKDLKDPYENECICLTLIQSFIYPTFQTELFQLKSLLPQFN